MVVSVLGLLRGYSGKFKPAAQVAIFFGPVVINCSKGSFFMRLLQHPHTLLVLCSVLLLSSCASLPPNEHQVQSLALTDTEDTSIGRAVAGQLQGRGEDSGFFVLSNGLDAFTARLSLARFAERSIDAKYYRIHKDLTGFGSVTRRMHNKSFTVDNQVTIVGCRNIGNEYCNADPALDFFDLDLLAIGPVVEEVFEERMPVVAFRLELVTDDDGLEFITWHGREDGQDRVWYNDPHTSFWKRFGVGFMGIFPIESQL